MPPSFARPLHRPGLALVAVATLLAPAAAPAGPVQFGTGRADFTYATTGDTDSKSFDVAAPGAAAVGYTGGPLATDPFTDRGDSQIVYNIARTGDGAALDVSATAAINGRAAATIGGTATFTLTVTTDEAMRYSLLADPGANAGSFRASFADAEGLLSISALGDISGNLVEDGFPAAKTFTGLLPAGAHTLLVESVVTEGRTSGTVFTGGSARLTLAADDGGGPTPIPLPPAAWTGLLTLAGVGAVSWLRDRRRAPRLRA